MSIQRQGLSVVIILLGIYLIISLSQDLWKLLEARERIARERQEVAKLEQEQQGLASRLEEVMSEEFVEREAREKLLMSKPGETVVLLPEEGKEEKRVLGQKVVDEEGDLANWEKWMRLFGFL